MRFYNLRRYRATRLLLALPLVLCWGLPARAQQSTQLTDTRALGRAPIIHKVEKPQERLEMIVNTSRILTLDVQIPKAQVNNPDIVKLTPLSPTQIQISALRAGVTQVNLWEEGGDIHTIDLIVYGDAQELQMLLEAQFPSANLKVVPLANSVVVSGYVDRPELVAKIVEVSSDYYPKVINNIRIGGVQQVLLHVKVMEVSRTKMRQLGFDFIHLSNGGFFASGVSGLLANPARGASAVLPGGETIGFRIVDGNSSFLGVLDALRQHNLAKILAEPDLVTVSGRPAFFNVGGEFPVRVPQSLGTVSIEYKKFGTQVDFVPIVLGNNRIRLEVRPRVSEIDETRSVTVADTEVPALRVREVDTGVEMRAGQTLAIAGLVQHRVEAINRGIPYVSDLPYVGAAFRRVEEEVNEVELLILVTPELVEAMDPGEVPPGGPGLNTVSPSDWDLYWKGHLEVPPGGYHAPPPAYPGGPGGADGHCYPGPAHGHEHVEGYDGDVYLTPPDVPGEEVPALPDDVDGLEDPSAGAWHRVPGTLPGKGRFMRPASGRLRVRASQNAQNSSGPQDPNQSGSAEGDSEPPGLIGPIGYDVRN